MLLWAIVGIVLIGVVLLDAFQTVVLPRRATRRGSTTVSKASSSTTPISTIPTIAQSSISVLPVPAQHVRTSPRHCSQGYDPGPAHNGDQFHNPLQNHGVERMLYVKCPLHRMPQAATGFSLQPGP